MDLSEMLRRVRDERESPQILPEAAIARLAEYAARYAEQLAGPRFGVGDLVTPVSDCDLRPAGAPHRVVDVRIGAAPEFGAGAYTNSNGGRFDIRVLCIRDDCVCAYWTESYKFERWTEAADVRAAD